MMIEHNQNKQLAVLQQDTTHMTLLNDETYKFSNKFFYVKHIQLLQEAYTVTVVQKHND
jgi:hypothetical protein